ncbi:uncharacterized protein LOC120681610 [Panicum virgatum]|uniref:PHD-type domain-containing protein n=1 Tax=Panicum virgatum TaxID=38727 RepID=A0A8T0PW27_PANVG|nr:uncharacterized protein LOC120681610 [Panicum virgatum]XP_039819107.1 uncharacterized protein LOC120681610 [Panicum virgatum]KAG2566691.1 hypothetical protein PVAP13_7NG175700 [Panicum virgatum]
MVQDAPNALASVTDHPAPPSRLVSKHRPRRRAAASASRPPLPPPAPAPDLTQCHCCGVRFPTPQPGAKPKRRPVRPLSSLWRVVLLCAECLSLVSSAAVCAYCLSLDNPPPEDSAVSCRRCRRFVHQSCIPAEHRTALIQPVDLEDFLCVDCCPTLRPKVGGFNLGMNLEAYPRDPTSVVGGDALRKAVEVKSPSKRGKEAVGTGFAGRGSGDPVLLDEELALQLHLAMNGSQRISRSGNSSSGASAELGKGNNGVVAGRNTNGNQEICITNMMAQLDDEEEPGRNRVLKRFRRSYSLVTVVLALECVKGKHTKERMKAKRKGPPVTLQQDGLVNPYKKKYSKSICDEKDIDGDHGDNGVAPMK